MALFGWEGLKKLGLRPQTPNVEAGTGPATKCESCGEILLKKTLENNLWVCPSCDHHHRITAWERVQVTLDEDSFEENDANLASVDPLDFRGAKSYKNKLEEAFKATGMISAMVGGVGQLRGRDVAFGVTDSRFIMGSMGSVVGEKIARLAERAIDRRLPLIMVSGSGGGARMYEGLFSLMQMAKTSAAIGRLGDAGLPFISVCTDCTMAGVWASWAALGDIIIAEPRALIGFTGPRVIKTTINCELPEGFQLSEFLLAHGQVDMIVHRYELRDRIAAAFDIMLGKTPEAAAAEK
jgi:acetyl-CoA carboxylase carboxyl transferase subunit beta